MAAPPTRRPAAQAEDGRTPIPLVLVAAGVVLVLVLCWFWFLRSGEAYVSGRVTLDGEPLGQAEVVFLGEGEESSAPLVAVTNDSGDYKIIGHQGGGIRPGRYKVTVCKWTLKDGTLPKGEALAEARDKELLRNLVPAAYADPQQTPLRYEIGSGQNTTNIPLKKHP